MAQVRAGSGRPGIRLRACAAVAAQALADVATIAILQQRAASEQRILAEQLQYALDSRVTIEQAKGVIAEHASLDMDDAFNALRQDARDRNERLVDIARAVASRDLAAADVAADLAPRITSDPS